MQRELAREHPTEYLAAFRTQLPLQIRFCDVDRLGHVNNSVHQEFFDLGRLHYFEPLLKPSPDWEGAVVILAHLEIDFLQPIFLDSKVIVYTRISLDFNEKSFVMSQALASPDRTQIYTISESLMVGYQAKEQRSMALLPAWLQQIRDFENAIQ